MKQTILMLTALWLALLPPLHAAEASAPPRPRLQIINGSTQTIDVFWMKYEYFAVGAAAWYGHNRFNDFDHNPVHLRSQLSEYDPALAALCREVFGDTAPPYTRPATRLTGHLAGYDPATAPRFVWPERLQKAKAEIHAQAQARDQAANGK